jgi:adenylate cyclase
MLGEVEKLHDKWLREGKPSLAIGIGINTGPVISGNVGSEAKMNYTVMGDNVNLTQRIQDLNKTFGSKLLISASTYEKVKDVFEFKELGKAQVKGKEEPVHIFEVLSKKQTT